MLNLIKKEFLLLERNLFFIVNQQHTKWLDSLTWCVTSTFFWLPLYLILIYLLIIKLKQETWFFILAIVLLIFFCDQFASIIVKSVIKWLGPCCDPSISTWVHVAGHYHGKYGFISSHAVTVVDPCQWAAQLTTLS